MLRHHIPEVPEVRVVWRSDQWHAKDGETVKTGTDASANFTTRRVKKKLDASQPLIDGRVPIRLSVDHQFTEIAIIKNGLAQRDGT